RVTASRGLTRTASPAPTIWPCSCRLPAMQTMPPARASAMPAAIAARRSPLTRAAGAPAATAAPMPAGSPARGWSSVMIRGTARAEDEDRPSARRRAQRIKRRLDGVGGVGIVDIDRRAGAGDRRAFEPSAHRLEPGEIAGRLRRITPRRDDEARRDERVGGLI